MFLLYYSQNYLAYYNRISSRPCYCVDNSLDGTIIIINTQYFDQLRLTFWPWCIHYTRNGTHGHVHGGERCGRFQFSLALLLRASVTRDEDRTSATVIWHGMVRYLIVKLSGVRTPVTVHNISVKKHCAVFVRLRYEHAYITRILHANYITTRVQVLFAKHYYNNTRR